MRRHFALDLGIEWDTLADSERRRFCEEVLSSIGVARWTATGSGNLIVSCPLPFGLHAHGDVNPSAALSWRKGLFNCSGCNNGGTLAWLIATCKGISSAEARRQIAALGPDGSNLSDMLGYFERLWASKHEAYTMPIYSPRVLEPWLQGMHPYLIERGVSPESVVRFLVGHDSVTDRIVIPHLWNETLVGWVSRRIRVDGSPKYKNSPDFPKDRTIFNFDRDCPEAVVVESPMSVLLCNDHPNIEATFGASVTDRQMRLLSRHEKVVLALDNDEAGWRATEALGESLMPYTAVSVLGNRWDGDVGDLTSAQFREAYDGQVPFSAWKRPQMLEALN